MHEENNQIHLYSEAVNSSTNLIITMDTDLKLTMVNDTFCRYNDVRREDVIGKTIVEVNGEELYYRSKPYFDACLAGNRASFEQRRWYDGAGERDMFVQFEPLLDRQGRQTGILSTVIDVTELREKEQQLEQERKEKELILEHAPVEIAYIRPDHTIVWANRAWKHSSATPAYERVAGKKCYEVFYNRRIPCENCHIEEVARTRREAAREYTTEDGKHIHITAAPVTDDEGAVTAVIEITVDITARIQAEKVLQRETMTYQTLLDQLPDSVFFKDHKHRFIRVNEAKAREQGTTPADMLGKTDFDYFSKEFAQKSYADDESVFRSGEPIINKEELVDTVRGKRWVLVTKLPLRDEEGTIIGTMGLSRDITPIKEAEQRIQEEVKEKDFLMQEIHHRIKNNLAMISSLIHLKASQFADEHELQDLEYQIETIRLVHEKLYQTDTIKNVDFSSYIQDLLTTIFSSFSGSPVKIENRITGISLDSKTAIYLGLIINEIATNAMKYSFDSNTENRFTLEMEEREDAPPEEEDRVSHPSPSAPVYVLTIKNSGEPIPKDVDLQNSSTLGMHLISALVEQLEGTITIEKEPSPQYIITIPA